MAPTKLCMRFGKKAIAINKCISIVQSVLYYICLQQPPRKLITGRPTPLNGDVTKEKLKT